MRSSVRATYDPARPFGPWLMAFVLYRLADAARRYALPPRAPFQKVGTRNRPDTPVKQEHSGRVGRRWRSRSCQNGPMMAKWTGTSQKPDGTPLDRQVPSRRVSGARRAVCRGPVQSKEPEHAIQTSREAQRVALVLLAHAEESLDRAERINLTSGFWRRLRDVRNEPPRSAGRFLVQFTDTAGAAWQDDGDFDTATGARRRMDHLIEGEKKASARVLYELHHRPRPISN